ncbi:hypothetical protein BGZ76_004962 [Entomortierella beljakovae]|nr:hypothetical protein BGZ76_004962 [Entomortierella beljakovae]
MTAQVLVKGAVPYATWSITRNTSKLEALSSVAQSQQINVDSEANDIHTSISKSSPINKPSKTDDHDQIESGSESELEYDDADTSAEEDSIESVVIVGDEKQRLLQMVENSKHDECEWIISDKCVVCKFKVYQKDCIEALTAGKLTKYDIPDAI